MNSAKSIGLLECPFEIRELIWKILFCEARERVHGSSERKKDVNKPPWLVYYWRVDVLASLVRVNRLVAREASDAFARRTDFVIPTAVSKSQLQESISRLPSLVKPKLTTLCIYAEIATVPGPRSTSQEHLTIILRALSDLSNLKVFLAVNFFVADIDAVRWKLEIRLWNLVQPLIGVRHLILTSPLRGEESKKFQLRAALSECAAIMRYGNVYGRAEINEGPRRATIDDMRMHRLDELCDIYVIERRRLTLDWVDRWQF